MNKQSSLRRFGTEMLLLNLINVSCSFSTYSVMSVTRWARYSRAQIYPFEYHLAERRHRITATSKKVAARVVVVQLLFVGIVANDWEWHSEWGAAGGKAASLDLTGEINDDWFCCDSSNMKQLKGVLVLGLGVFMFLI